MVPQPNYVRFPAKKIIPEPWCSLGFLYIMLRGGILALPRHSPPPKYDICTCLYSLQVNYIKLKLKAISDRAQIIFYMTRLFLFGKKPLLGLYTVNFNWPLCVCKVLWLYLWVIGFYWSSRGWLVMIWFVQFISGGCLGIICVLLRECVGKQHSPHTKT